MFDVRCAPVCFDFVLRVVNFGFLVCDCFRCVFWIFGCVVFVCLMCWCCCCFCVFVF